MNFVGRVKAGGVGAGLLEQSLPSSGVDLGSMDGV